MTLAAENRGVAIQAGPNVRRAVKGVPDQIRTGSAKRRRGASVRRPQRKVKKLQPRRRAKIAPGVRAVVVVVVVADEGSVKKPADARSARHGIGRAKVSGAKAPRANGHRVNEASGPNALLVANGPSVANAVNPEQSRRQAIV